MCYHLKTLKYSVGFDEIGVSSQKKKKDITFLFSVFMLWKILLKICYYISANKPINEWWPPSAWGALFNW